MKFFLKLEIVQKRKKNCRIFCQVFSLIAEQDKEFIHPWNVSVFYGSHKKESIKPSFFKHCLCILQKIISNVRVEHLLFCITQERRALKLHIKSCDQNFITYSIVYNDLEICVACTSIILLTVLGMMYLGFSKYQIKLIRVKNIKKNSQNGLINVM